MLLLHLARKKNPVELVIWKALPGNLLWRMPRHSPFHFHACWPWERQPLNVQYKYLEVILILSFPQLLQNRIILIAVLCQFAFLLVTAADWKQMVTNAVPIHVLFAPSDSTPIPSLTKRKTLTIWIVEKTNSEYWPNLSSYSELPEPAKRQQNCPSVFWSCSVLFSYKRDHWHRLPLKRLSKCGYAIHKSWLWWPHHFTMVHYKSEGESGRVNMMTDCNYLPFFFFFIIFWVYMQIFALLFWFQKTDLWN